MENILEKINQAGLTLLDTITPEDTYVAVVNEGMRLVNAEFSSILLAKNKNLVRVYASEPFFSKLKLKKGGTIETAFLQNKLIVNNITADTKVDPLIREKGIQSVILIPLVYRSDSIGVLTILSLKKEHFTKKEVDMLRVFGSMASFAIKKSHLYDETKKALEIRDMFISMAAHELRTPLTSISGYIQLLYSKLAKNDTPEGKWISALYDENKRMMLLVKEILEVNRLKAGQLQFRWQECNLAKIVTDAVREVQQRYPERIIQFKSLVKEETVIIGDSDRLLQVFYNILDNALKYSKENTAVEVVFVTKGKEYSISIKDYGKGIEDKDLPNIFSGQHKGGGGEEGFGLGLYFVENIIRQHRGSIQVESIVSEGTTFEMKFPQAMYEQ